MAAPALRVLWQPFFYLSEHWNGMDEHMLHLSRHLDRTRYDLLLLTHESDGPQTTSLAAQARLRAVPAPPGAGSSLLERIRSLRALYRREAIDLLHLHSPTVGGQFAAALAARLAGVRAVLATYHQVQMETASARARAINRLTHSRLIDATVAVSNGVRQSLARHTGVPTHRVRVIHNGIDAPLSVQSVEPAVMPPRWEGEVRLGYFGRLSPEKGLRVLLDAMADLTASTPAVRLLIAGDGPQRAELAAHSARLGLADRVDFLGFRPDARAIMARVDVVVHTPAYEGFGLAVLEAMAAGRPVVVTDAPGGLSEIVSAEENGLVVPTGSPAALADALRRLVHDPVARQRLGERGAARFRTGFTAAHMAASVSRLYDEALDRFGPNR
jgi:glycosyltransferase involved in cell wall biosynthesis